MSAQRELTFDGPDLTADDTTRLTGQLDDVKRVMRRGLWMTLEQIAGAAGGYPEQSVSARLRDLRKPRFGGHTIERRRKKGHRGLYEYRMVLP